ncbi:MAG TPA: hypothetical protein VII75_09520 [Thermoanaerobaculia bacterium]|nr:hypothetical protein [Thermoanaerobaculia bacterium]
MKTVLLSMLLAASFALHAQDISGHWAVDIAAGDKNVRIELDLANGAGTFDFPAQNLKALPLANVALHAGAISFEIKGSGGGVFTGTLATDRKSAKGTFAMSGAQTMEAPFTMTRTGDAIMQRVASSPAIGKQFEGRWSNVGGSYAGKVVDDGSISGTWTQKPFSGPLTFHRTGNKDAALARWADAAGGRDKVTAIKSIYREATVDAAGFSGTLKVWHTAGGKFRKEEKIGPFSTVETFDGTNCIVQQGDKPLRTLSGHELEIETSKAYANSNAVMFAFSPDASHGGVDVDADGTIVLRPRGGIDWRITLDPQTSLPGTMVHQEGPRTITVTFASYETIDGIRLEKELHRTNGDHNMDAVIRFTKTVLNQPFDDALFTRR